MPEEKSRQDDSKNRQEHHEHDHHEHDLENPGAAVVTVSSSRSLDDDPSGDAIRDVLEENGFEIVTRELVNDEFDTIQHIVDTLTHRDDLEIVVTTGGTGVTPDDVTVEAVQPLISKTLPGFGELFRTLSYDEVGTRVVGTRAIAGIIDGVPVFCLPGSENAVRLGCEEIIVEEAPHLVGLASRDSDEE
jgi:molybdopterin adenylyltransferase